MRSATATDSHAQVTDAQIAEDLRSAARLIREHGLAQGRYHDPVTGGYDQSGAIMEGIARGFWSARSQPTYFTDWHKARYLLAEEAMRSFLGATAIIIPGLGSAVTRWNDTPGRTALEVEAALLAAAALIEIGEAA